VVVALSKIGYKRDRQKGSHIVLRQVAYPHRRVVVPDHREVAKGTLRKIIKQVGLTVEEFKQLL
jgi:predicted RNA binding protein YcfA (HicA-like mRNA interferase family)